MVVDYTKEQGEIYLNEIHYTGNESVSPSNYVKFYLANRNDTPVMYAANFSVRTAKRLLSIEIQSSGNIVRAYNLEYTDRSKRVKA